MGKVSKRAALQRYKSLELEYAPNADELPDEERVVIFTKVCARLSREERRALGLRGDLHLRGSS